MIFRNIRRLVFLSFLLGTTSGISKSQIRIPSNNLNYSLGSQINDLSLQNRCIDHSNGITSNLLSCGGVEIDRQFKIMDLMLRTIQMRVQPATWQKMLQLQASWHVNLKRECEHDPDVIENSGGTLADLAYQGCFQFGVLTRNRWLRRRYRAIFDQ